MENIPKLLHPLVGFVMKRTMASPEPHFLYNLPPAEEIKKHVSIPVIVVGGIRKLEEIKNIIEQERCDFVSMSRQFIIKPNLVKKFKKGRQRESKCINCNYCLIGSEKHPLKCYYGRMSVEHLCCFMAVSLILLNFVILVGLFSMQLKIRHCWQFL